MLQKRDLRVAIQGVLLIEGSGYTVLTFYIATGVGTVYVNNRGVVFISVLISNGTPQSWLHEL